MVFSPAEKDREMNKFIEYESGLTAVGVVNVSGLHAGSAIIGRVILTNGSEDTGVTDGGQDSRVNSITGLYTNSRLMGYNGVSWDRLKLTAGSYFGIVNYNGAGNEIFDNAINAGFVNIASGGVPILGSVHVVGSVAVTNTVDILGSVAVTNTVDVLGSAVITNTVDILGSVAVTNVVDMIGSVSVTNIVDMTGSVVVTNTVDMLGSVAVTNTVDINKSGLSTDTNQTDGSQKTQVVDAVGNIIDAQFISGTTDNIDEKYGLITASTLYSRINDSTVRPVSMDGVTHALTTIEYEHKEIHSGDHYYVCSFETLDSGVSADFSVSTPNTAKWLHMTFEIEGTSQTEMIIYEDATVSGGVTVSPFNNNRNSSNTSAATLAMNPSVTVPGTIIYSQSNGLAGATPSKASSQGIVNRNREIILKSGTTYRFEIASADDDNIVTYCGEWYEHTNKN